MPSVCRMCARWAEHVLGIDDKLLNNLRSAKQALRDMFGLNLSCTPPYPNQVCVECVQCLENSYLFHQQLLNAEKVFTTLQERGELSHQLSQMKKAGDVLQFVEMVEEESGSELSQHEADERVGSVDIGEESNDRDATMDEEDYTPAKPSEHVIEVKIEAMEELEIISCPLETVGTNDGQSSQGMPNSADEDGDENHSPDIRVKRNHGSNSTAKGVNESCREPMAVTVPPEQKANGTVVRNKCYVCYRSYGTEAELMSHLIKHNDLLPYRCRQCSTPNCVIEFRTNQALNKHLEWHMYPFECTDCRMCFKEKDSINEHLRIVHMAESWYTCKWCGLKFHEKRKYRLHVNAHRNMESDRHKTANKLLEHQKQVHPRARRLHECPYCSRSFKYSLNYELHKQSHLKTESLFQCTEVSCRKKFSCFREWRRHMKTHFPNKSVYLKRAHILPESLRDPNTYPTACITGNCCYVAPALQQMLAHYGRHLKWYRCQICKVCMDLPALRQHMVQFHDATPAVR